MSSLIVIMRVMVMHMNNAINFSQQYCNDIIIDRTVIAV